MELSELTERVFESLALQSKELRKKWVSEISPIPPRGAGAPIPVVISNDALSIITSIVRNVLKKIGGRASFCQRGNGSWLLQVVRHLPENNRDISFSEFTIKITEAFKQADVVLIDTTGLDLATEYKKTIDVIRQIQGSEGKTAVVFSQHGGPKLSQQLEMDIFKLMPNIIERPLGLNLNVSDSF